MLACIEKTLTGKYEIPLFLEALNRFPKKMLPSTVGKLKTVARKYSMQDLVNCLDELIPVFQWIHSTAL